MVDEFHFLLMQCGNLCYKTLVSKVKPLGLTAGQPKVLECLSHEDGLSPKAIGDLCAIDKSTMTSLLDKMEKSDLISRTANENDRRATRIWLTKKGADTASQVNLLTKETNSLALAGLSEDEKKELSRLLTTVFNSLKGGN